MKTFRTRFIGCPTIVVLAAMLSTVPNTASAQVAQDMEILTQGPIHEAFAKVTQVDPIPGDIVFQAPPDPIDELPPDARPDGDNVSWIPGYWAWDDDREDFIWVSGVWRVIPPGRQWIPGYWNRVSQGYQWTSGFWAGLDQTETVYLPPPPEPLEYGPSSPSPGDDYLWTPGSWIWRDTSYAWQPGYWIVQRPNWMWVSSYYSWTPRGHVYIPGYWDYDIVHRGVIFAPVYYSSRIYRRPDYYYSPAIVIDIRIISSCLFARPRTHHYYFGDYFDRRYEDRGYYPWYSPRVSRYGYDPIYTHYRRERIRYDRDWDERLRRNYEYRREHPNARPPRTLAQQINIVQTNVEIENLVIGRELSDVVQSEQQPLRFSRVDMERRRELQSRGREVQKLQAERAQAEQIEAVTAEAPEGGAERRFDRPTRVRLPKSPVAAAPIERTQAEGAEEAGAPESLDVPPPVPEPEAQRSRPTIEGEAPDAREPDQQREPGERPRREREREPREQQVDQAAPDEQPAEQREQPARPERRERVERPGEVVREPERPLPTPATPQPEQPAERPRPERAPQRQAEPVAPTPVPPPATQRRERPQQDVQEQPRTRQPQVQTQPAPQQERVRVPEVRRERAPQARPERAPRPVPRAQPRQERQPVIRPQPAPTPRATPQPAPRQERIRPEARPAPAPPPPQTAPQRIVPQRPERRFPGRVDSSDRGPRRNI